MTAGYSGTPLPKKLGLRPGHRLLLENAPGGFLPDRPEGVEEVAAGPADVIVAFHSERAGVEEAVRRLRAAMEPSAGLWIAWPKRASKVPTDVTEDVVREIALANALVDNKVCAIDETWSGLRLVIRLKDR
jgi:hypothetical protein